MSPGGLAVDRNSGATAEEELSLCWLCIWGSVLRLAVELSKSLDHKSRGCLDFPIGKDWDGSFGHGLNWLGCNAAP